MNRRIFVGMAAAGALATLGMGCEAETQKVVNPSSCTTVQKLDGSAVVQCSDGSSALIKPGLDGQNGLDGTPCSLLDLGDGVKELTCGDATFQIVDGKPGVDGVDGVDGKDGKDGKDGSSCTVAEVPDGYMMTCPDGSSVTWHDGEQGPQGEQGIQGEKGEKGDQGEAGEVTVMSEPLGKAPVTEEDLTEDDIVWIDTMRGSIEKGLEIGKETYIDTISVDLSSSGIVNDYAGVVNEDFSGTELVQENCPFIKYYDNGIEPSEANCSLITDLSMAGAKADVDLELLAHPLDEEVTGGEMGDDATFWYEQGAIAGIEQHRVLVRVDLQEQLFCNTKPSAYESSYDKGVAVGHDLLAEKFNEWLAAQGQTADYPKMSKPITVCNINVNALNPAKNAALADADDTVKNIPLCAGFSPPTTQMANEYAVAEEEYLKGIQKGINDEFALAAVKIFKVVPCNVGDPLVVDLDGDGIELASVAQGVNFDFYGTGSKQAVAWVAGDDALLVLDRNENGTVDSGLELFGNVEVDMADGFAHLATLDSNRDGVVDAADRDFASLQLWQDVNRDGVSQASELRAASSVLSSLPVAGSDVSMRSNRVRVTKAADAVGVDGKAYLVGDAMLTTAPYASPRFER